MNLSRKIGTLLRSVLVERGTTGSKQGLRAAPSKLDAELDRIQKSLIKSAVREQQLETELAQAESDGNVRQSIQLRRDLEDLRSSTEGLLAALDLIESRIQTAHDSQESPAAVSDRLDVAADLPQDSSSQASSDINPAAEDSDLLKRKSRLSGGR